MPTFCLDNVGFWRPCHATAIAWHFSQLEKLSAWQGLFCFSPAMNDRFPSFSLLYFFPSWRPSRYSIMEAFPKVLFQVGILLLVYSRGICCPTRQIMHLSNITPPGIPFHPRLSIPAPGLLLTFREAFLSSLARPLYHKNRRLIITKVSTKMLSHV